MKLNVNFIKKSHVHLLKFFLRLNFKKIKNIKKTLRKKFKESIKVDQDVFPNQIFQIKFIKSYIIFKNKYYFSNFFYFLKILKDK
jgi:hypothetical protein